MESMLVSKSNSPPHPRAHAFLHSDISMCVCIHGHTHAHTHRGYSLAEAPLGAWSPLSDTQDPLTCDVVHHHGHCRVPDVAGDQAAEPLLARCVPELQSHLLQGGPWGQRGSGVHVGSAGVGERTWLCDAGTASSGAGTDSEWCPPKGPGDDKPKGALPVSQF